MANVSTGIQEFYAGRSVFITGATGFMGKVLVEKLLRSCPEIGCLYLLVRPTSDKYARFRLKELLKCEVRMYLKCLPSYKNCGNFISKLKLVVRMAKTKPAGSTRETDTHKR